MIQHRIDEFQRLLAIGRIGTQPEAWVVPEILDQVDGIDWIVRAASSLSRPRKWPDAGVPVRSVTLETMDWSETGLQLEGLHCRDPLSARPEYIILATSVLPAVAQVTAWLERLRAWAPDACICFEPRDGLKITEVLDWLDGVNGVGLSLDTKSLGRTEYNVAYAIDACNQYIRFVRVSDVNGWAPGMGPLDWPSIRAAIARCKHRPVLSLDMLWRPNLEAALASALDVFQ